MNSQEHLEKVLDKIDRRVLDIPDDRKAGDLALGLFIAKTFVVDEINLVLEE